MSSPARPVVAVLFGGQSSEHAISCLSAGSVLAALDREKYDVIALGITRQGRWVLADADPTRYRVVDGVLPEVDETRPLVCVEFGGGAAVLCSEDARIDVDVIFPLLHGAYGEDGTVQGLLELSGIAYVGSGVLSSAMAMDKIVMKQMLERAGLPTLPWVSAEDSVEKLTLPFFVKPARAGSSNGITRVDELSNLGTAIDVAHEHDPRVIIEQGVNAREIECAVLENVDGSLETSLPGEVVVVGDHPFYDFDAKYLDGSTRLDVPAELPEGVAHTIRNLAKAAFRALQCEGLARVDFFLTDDNEIFVNEVNTMPGFTPTSMYPLMFKSVGVKYPTLVARLLERAQARPRTVLR
jgi:D-alanine-D-alanine ligase